MPLIDLPLPELQRYLGRNPRPADFDTYWAAALQELEGTDPQPELRPCTAIQPKNAQAFELWFTGVGGARIHAKYLRPNQPTGGRHPALLLFHGYSHHSGDWMDKLAWVNEGFCVAAMDCRGQGGLSQDSGSVLGSTLNGHIVRGLDDPDATRLLYRAIYLDTVQLARVLMAMPEVDAARISTHGGSQGGGLALACAALEPRIHRVSSIYPFLSDYQRVWEMDLAQHAYQELRTHFRHHDPLHERRDEVFTRLGYIDVQHLAPRIQCPVQMHVGLMDTVCPPSTQFAAYNRITSAKEMVLYPDFAHEHLPGAADRTLGFLAD